MAANYVLLEKITVGAAGASSVTFSGIPQTGYTDLVIKASTRGTRSATNAEFFIKFNGVTFSGSYKLLQGNGSAAASQSGSSGLAGVSDAATNTANTFANSEIYIPNYTSANKKSYSIESLEEENSAAATYMYMIAGLWDNTAAITSIELTPEGGTSWSQYSTFYLYGVAKLGTTPAIAPKATGGSTIMTDGTYWYHTFLSSGTFTPSVALSCDYLVVAGGGGGGTQAGGGGGAGGLRSTVTATGGGGSLETALSLTSGVGYTVTIGAGGSGNANYSAGAPTTSPTSGSNSVFSTITSTGGGRGGSYSLNTGAIGGSGGGGTYYYNPTGAVGTANQGYAGGNGSVPPGAGNLFGGGGGGAGSNGSNGSSSNVGGNGGNGVAVSISGSSVTYAGGGGGGGGSTSGTGGTGGGGNGTTNGVGVAGTANTGGGGGGQGGSDANGGNGGSGIVIVRYAV